jgi:hypothetical protein
MTPGHLYIPTTKRSSVVPLVQSRPGKTLSASCGWLLWRRARERARSSVKMIKRAGEENGEE